MGERMVGISNHVSPDVLHKILIKFGKAYAAKCEQFEIDRVNPTTTRYLDWK
jgi:hypothetical protein